MKILCIAPAAPPLNQAEPIQVFRILQHLLKTDDVDLVSEPLFGSWARSDDALVLKSARLRRLEVALPLHSLSMRVIGHRFLRRFAPLTDHWIAWHAARVARWSRDADIIYTRSYPTRAALLGKALKERTGKPWVMHLSDPWADNSEDGIVGIGRALAEADERDCVAAADRIALTTTEQAAHMSDRYPKSADKLFVTPNVVRAGARRAATSYTPGRKLDLVFAGSLYGRRSIAPLLDAIASLPEPQRSRLDLTVAGNAVPTEADRMSRAGEGVRYLGLLPYEEADRLQKDADILVTIEPQRANPSDGMWLMSKLVEYLAIPKPILAITPPGSVTANLVDGRFGWSVDPADPQAIAALLTRILNCPASFDEPIPAALTPTVAVRDLRHVFESLVQ